MTVPVPPEDPLYRAPIVEERERVVVQDRVVEPPSLPVTLGRLVWLLFGFIEALIGLRIVLKLIAANPASPFAALVYFISDIFVWPFAGLVATPAAGGMVFEISSIIAMFVYALLAWGLVELIYLLLYPGRSRVRVTERRQRY